jgi:hypothetical protein
MHHLIRGVKSLSHEIAIYYKKTQALLYKPDEFSGRIVKMNCVNSFGRSGILLLTLLMLTACASNPMKARFNKNFVYNCSLQLLEKNVSVKDAERICESSHRAELEESQVDTQEQVATTKPIRTAQKKRILAPPIEDAAEEDNSADEERMPASDSSDDHSGYEKITQRKSNHRK